MADADAPLQPRPAPNLSGAGSPRVANPLDKLPAKSPRASPTEAPAASTTTMEDDIAAFARAQKLLSRNERLDDLPPTSELTSSELAAAKGSPPRRGGGGRLM